jgi:CPA2 family monovalent cation:H+ antiporter-2
MNLETIHRLRADGMTAVYGDAHHPETLKHAGITQAGTLFLSASGLIGAKEIVRMARDLNPEIRVLARSAYLRERTELRQAGADEVYAGEGEVALAMTESLLRKLGATPDQIDKERDRVRADLFGDPLSPDDALKRHLVTEEAAEEDEPRASGDPAELGEAQEKEG